MKEKELNELIATLNEKNLSIGFAESVTAGMVCCEFSKGLNVSDSLKGSVVSYTEEVKEKILQVDKETIAKYTAESKEVTHEMAIGLKKLYDVDLAVAITGLANPGGSETKEKPVGTIFICILVSDKEYHFRSVFSGSRDDILYKASGFVLKKLQEVVASL
jgi:nicotinamide-nucleotide amidase